MTDELKPEDRALIELAEGLKRALGPLPPTTTLHVMQQNPADHYYWSKSVAEVLALDLFQLADAVAARQEARTSPPPTVSGEVPEGVRIERLIDEHLRCGGGCVEGPDWGWDDEEFSRVKARLVEALLATPSPAEPAQAGEVREWRENVEAMLGDGDPDVIRCHEGGGPESLVGSLALTMIRTRKARDTAQAEIARLKGALEPFAHVAREDGDAADFDDERVLRLVYDDPEWGDNTVLAEFFMRPFRKARAAISDEQRGEDRG